VNIVAIKAKLADIEALEERLLDARQSLRALVDGFDPPIPLVPTAAAERVGKRRPRPARRVAPEALEAVREALRNGPVPASVVANDTELRHPTVLAALGQLVADGVAVKTGDKRGARWGLTDG